MRYAGKPLAIFVAADRYVAEDARDATRLDIEPLPVLFDPTDAARSDVQLFPGKGNVAAQKDFGEPIDESVWQDAAVVVQAGCRQQLPAHTYMEAKALLVQPEPDARLTVRVSHQGAATWPRDSGCDRTRSASSCPTWAAPSAARTRRGPSTSLS